MYSWTDLRRRGDDGEPLVTLDDICTFNEILLVDAENERRAHKAAQKRARTK